MKSCTAQIAYASITDQIATQLRGEFARDYTDGSRLPTVLELARRFDVSTNTIGKVLDTLAREGLITKRRGRGVHVTRRLHRYRIGLLSELDLLHPRTGHYFRGLASALHAELRKHGAESLLYTGHHLASSEPPDTPTCPQFWTDAAAGRFDGGVIIAAPYTAAWIERFRISPVPLVGSIVGHGPGTDTAGIAAAAVRRLAARGARRIGLMTWTEESVGLFRREVAAQGLATDDAWISHAFNPGQAGAGWDEFREIWRRASAKPDGLVILDDMLFHDAQMAMFELGVRVPEDLRLVVQTNRGSEVPIRVPLDAIEIDPAEAAVALAEAVLKRVRGEALPPKSPTLSFREIEIAPMPDRGAEGRRVEGGGLKVEGERLTLNVGESSHLRVKR
jgi:DNA-binding LacI/PurR family transcriptional regulator